LEPGKKMAIIGIIVTVGVSIPVYFIATNSLSQTGDDNIGVIGDDNKIQINTSRDSPNSPIIQGNATINYFQNVNSEQKDDFDELEKSFKPVSCGSNEELQNGKCVPKFTKSTHELSTFPSSDKDPRIPPTFFETFVAHAYWAGSLDIYVDNDDFLYITDSPDQSVRKFNKNGDYVDEKWGAYRVG